MFDSRLQIVITNPSATAPIHAYRLPITINGLAYSIIKSACRSDLADLDFQDTSGIGLSWGLQADTGSALNVLVKIPFIAAAGTVTITAAFGDAAVTLSSGNLESVETNAPKPALSILYSQQDNDDGHGYNGSPSILKLRYQQGAMAYKNGNLLLTFCEGGGVLGTLDQQSNGHGFVGSSADEGASYHWRDIKSGSGMACLPLSSLLEDPATGAVYLFYSYGTNAQILAGTAQQFVCKSLDGGATWNTAQATALPQPFDPSWTIWSGYGQMLLRPNGDYWLPYYGGLTPSLTRAILLRCPAGSDPTVGASWGLLNGTLAGATVIAAASGYFYNEMTVITTTDDNHLLAIVRIDPGPLENTLATARSSDGGVTWVRGADARLPTRGTMHKVAPWLFRTSDGLLWLTYGERDPGGGQMLTVSYDQGETWATPFQMFFSPTITGSYGYGNPEQMLDGSLRLVCDCPDYDGTAGNGNAQYPGVKVVQMRLTMDYLFNTAFRQFGSPIPSYAIPVNENQSVRLLRFD